MIMLEKNQRSTIIFFREKIFKEVKMLRTLETHRESMDRKDEQASSIKNKNASYILIHFQTDSSMDSTEFSKAISGT